VLVGMGVGAAQKAIDLTLSHTQQRKAFGGPLYDLGAIRQRIAMNQAKLDAVRASMYHAAWLHDEGADNVKEMSGVKAFVVSTVSSTGPPRTRAMEKSPSGSQFVPEEKPPELAWTRAPGTTAPPLLTTPERVAPRERRIDLFCSSFDPTTVTSCGRNSGCSINSEPRTLGSIGIANSPAESL